MPSTRRPRIVRRAVMVVAVVVLLVSGYIGAWVLLPQLYWRGWMHWTTVNVLETTVFAPISLYTVEQWPGSDWLNALRDIVNGREVDRSIEA